MNRRPPSSLVEAGAIERPRVARSRSRPGGLTIAVALAGLLFGPDGAARTGARAKLVSSRGAREGTARVVSLVVTAPADCAAALRSSLGELGRRLGIELREPGRGPAWAELTMSLTMDGPTSGHAIVIVRDGETRQIRLERRLRGLSSAQLLVETAATVAYTGLEAMVDEASEEPPAETSPQSAPEPRRHALGPSPPALAPSHAVPAAELQVAPPLPGGASMEPATFASATSGRHATPPAAEGDHATTAAIEAVSTPGAPPTLASAASAGDAETQAGVRVALESSAAFAPISPTWGYGLAATLALPAVPLAPRLAAGATFWRDTGDHRAGAWTDGPVVSGELAVALLHTESWSWHLGPIASWTRQTSSNTSAPGAPPPDQHASADKMLPVPGPNGEPLPNAQPLPSGAPAPTTAPPPTGETTRNVLDVGVSSRLAWRFTDRAEVFSTLTATSARRFNRVDPGRDMQGGSPSPSTSPSTSWTVLASFGVAVALTPR